MIPVRIVGASDPEYSAPTHDHLWVLAGGADYFDGATAAYPGADRDVEGDDLAGRNLADAAASLGERDVDVEVEQLRQALSDYRAARAAAWPGLGAGLAPQQVTHPAAESGSLKTPTPAAGMPRATFKPKDGAADKARKPTGKAAANAPAPRQRNARGDSGNPPPTKGGRAKAASGSDAGEATT